MQSEERDGPHGPRLPSRVWLQVALRSSGVPYYLDGPTTTNACEERSGLDTGGSRSLISDRCRFSCAAGNGPIRCALAALVTALSTIGVVFLQRRQQDDVKSRVPSLTLRAAIIVLVLALMAVAFAVGALLRAYQ